MLINEKTAFKVKAGLLAMFMTVAFIPSAVPKSLDAPVRASEAPTSLDKYRDVESLTDTELVELLSLVGFKGHSLKLAWAVVMRESRGNPTSRNNTSSTGDNSYGLFQINMIGNLGVDRRDKFGIKTNNDLFDPVTNAQAAFYMTARGTNFGSWGLGPDAYDGTASESAVTDWISKFPK